MLRISSVKLIIVFLLIPLILNSIWFSNGLLHGGGEEGILYYNPEKILRLSTSVWVDFTAGASVMLWLQQMPVAYLSMVFEKFGLPHFLFQAIIFYTLMTIGVFSTYYLTLTVLKKDEEDDAASNKNSKIIAFISAVFYLFNPFTISQIWGRSLSTQYFAFALFPLTLLLFYLGFNRKKYIFGLFAVLASSALALAYQFLTFIIVYWLVILIFFIHRLVISNNRTKEALFGIKFFFLTSIFWFFLNAWWFVPLFLSFGNINSVGTPHAEDNLGSLLGVSRNYPLEVIVRLLHKGYFFDFTAYSQIYSTIPFQLISLVPFLLVILGLIKILKNKEQVKLRFFVILLVLGCIISAGANPPFGWLFVWLFKSVFVLQAFRNPFEKFGLVYALGYSVIFAYGLVYFLNNKKSKKFLLFLVLFLTCIVYAWPMWTGRVIAGYDKKIGLDIPTYYSDLRKWLSERGEDYRVLMTPIWVGDSAFYQWNDAARYQGSDPMIYMLDQGVISNSARGAYYSEFITYVRNHMQREDVVPALFLLRTKFLVDRKDAILVTDTEKEHYKFLASNIYPPLGKDSNLKSICQNKIADAKPTGVAWVTCTLNKENTDLSNIKYLHIKIKTDVPASVEVSLRDTKDAGIVWHGRVDPEYSTDTNDWQYITIPLRSPADNNSNIDLSKSNLIEIWAYLKDHPEVSVNKIEIAEIKLDPGTEKRINEFRQVAELGKLTVFEPTNFNSPPEFGSLSSIAKVQGFSQLFEKANEDRSQIDKKGFVLTSQNLQKDLQSLPDEVPLRIIDKNKLSETRYWLQAAKDQGAGLLLLSKTFDPNWKVIAGVSKDRLSGNIFDDLKLLKLATLPEDNHFVVNGYANLWKIDGKDNQYAIVFIPQIIAEISLKVSIFSLLIISGLILLWGIKKRIISKFY